MSEVTVSSCLFSSVWPEPSAAVFQPQKTWFLRVNALAASACGWPAIKTYASMVPSPPLLLKVTVYWFAVHWAYSVMSDVTVICCLSV